MISRTTKIIKIYDQLLAVAKKDGIFSLDENILIKNIMKNFEKYLQIIDDALDDGIITGNERLKLFHSRMAMMQDAIETASIDETISKDEFELLKKIQNILDDIDRETIKPK